MTAKYKRPGMKWYLKLIIMLAVSTLVFYIGSMVYLVKAKYAMNEYVVQLGLAFNAATMVNAEETYTDDARAVIAEYAGERSVIVPENYKLLSSYLKWSHAMPPLAFVDKEEALRITICADSRLYIEGDDDGQGATVRFETGEDRFTMHVASVDLWEKILTLCLEGGKTPNIPL